jgi:glycine cleavage system H protein
MRRPEREPPGMPSIEHLRARDLCSMLSAEFPQNLLSMNVPEDREYTESHEWIRMDGDSAMVGLTAGDPASLMESARVELPRVSSAVKAGDSVAAVIFPRAAKRLVRAPLSGTVIEVNRELETHPELVQKDPYGAGWLFRLEIQAGEEIEHLLEPAVYRKRLRAAETMDVESP